MGTFLLFHPISPNSMGTFLVFQIYAQYLKKPLGTFSNMFSIGPKRPIQFHGFLNLFSTCPKRPIQFHEIHYNYSNHKNQLTKSLDYPNIMTPLFHHCNTEPVHSIAHSTFRWYPVKGLRGFPSEPPCPHQTLLFHRRTYRKIVCG